LNFKLNYEEQIRIMYLQILIIGPQQGQTCFYQLTCSFSLNNYFFIFYKAYVE